MTADIKRGEIYLIDWNPACGSEQACQRPGVVVQTDIANSVRGYLVTIVCAVSSKLKSYPSMVRLVPSGENGLSAVSEVDSGQIMTIQRGRLVRRLGRLSAADMQVLAEELAYMLDIAHTLGSSSG